MREEEKKNTEVTWHRECLGILNRISEAEDYLNGEGKNRVIYNKYFDKLSIDYQGENTSLINKMQHAIEGLKAEYKSK